MVLFAVTVRGDLVGGGLPSLPLTPAHAESDPSIDLGKLIADTLSRLIQQRRAKTSVGIMPLKDDGKIAFEDFRSAVTSLGLASTEARRIFDHFDHENTGFIDFNELHAVDGDLHLSVRCYDDMMK